MSYNYQLFNQNFVSSELYYLPLNTGIGKIITCKDLLGEFEWSNLSSIAVTSIQSDNTNILINNLDNNPQHGNVTIHLNNDLNLNSITLSSIYGNVNIYNSINLNFNNINYVNTINAITFNGEKITLNSPPSNNTSINSIIGTINIDADGFAYNFADFKAYFNITNRINYSTIVCNTLYSNVNFQSFSNAAITGGLILNQARCDINGNDNVSMNNYMSRIVGYEIQAPRFYSNSNNKTIDYIYGLSIENNPLFYGDSYVNIVIGLYIGNTNDTTHTNNRYGFYIDATNNYINQLRIGANGLNLDSNDISNINKTYTNKIYVDNIYEKSLGNNININNSINLNSNDINSINKVYSNKIYIDNIYENTLGNNIIFNNQLDINTNNIINVNNLYTTNIYGEIKTSNQPSITVLSNCIRAGNLDTINSNNIQPYTSSISLGTSINPFLNCYFTNIFSTTNKVTNFYVNNVFENTLNNKIIFNNDIKLNGVNILNSVNNTCNIGSSTSLLSSSYTNNIYTNNIYEATLNSNITIRNNTILNGVNIYPAVNNTNSLGLNGYKFNALHLYNGYIDKIYEANTLSGISFMNNTSYNNTNMSNINTLTATTINGTINTATQNTISTMTGLASAGILRNLNTSTINTSGSGTVSLGSTSHFFLNAYFSGTIQSATLRNDTFYEKTLNNGINIGSKTILNNINLYPLTNNTCNIGLTTNLFSNIYSSNINVTQINNNGVAILFNSSFNPVITNTLSIGASNKLFNLSYITNSYVSVIGSVDLNPITILDNTLFNNKQIRDVNGLKFYNETEYLSSYVENSFSLTYSLAWTGNITVYYVKIGKNITLIFPSDSISRSVSSNYLKLMSIPVGLRPLNSIFGNLYGSDNSTGKQLSYVIQNDGIIYIGNSSVDIFSYFTAGTLIAGFYGFSISYRI